MSKSDGSTADYYELPAGCTELQDLISHRDLNAQLGEIFRACYRYGHASHSDKMRDAKKIRFYADAEVKRLEKLERQKAGECENWSKPAPFTGGHLDAGATYLAGEKSLPCNSPVRGIYVDPYDAPSPTEDDAPSWDDAPEWAMWLAQQEHGAWEFYEDKPTCERGTYWRHKLRGVRVRADVGTRDNPDWRNTLQARPNKDA